MNPVEAPRWLLAREISQLAGVTPQAVRKLLPALPPKAKKYEPNGRGGRAWRLLVSALPGRWRARILQADPSHSLGISPGGSDAAKAAQLGGGPTGEGAAPVAAHCDGALPAAIVSPAPAGAEAPPDSAGGAARESQGGGVSPTSPTEATALVPQHSALALFPRAGLTQSQQDSLAGLSEAQQQRALARYDVIAPLLQRRRGLTRTRAIAAAAERAGLSARVVWHWLTGYEKADRQQPGSGLAALAGRPHRRDKGATRLTPDQQKHLLVLFNSPEKRSVKACWELLGYEIELGAILGPRPSYPACRRFLEAANCRPLADLTREGEKRFYDRHEPVALRDISGIPPNFWWVADFRQVDVRDRDANDQLGREWMCVIEDIGSAAWVGHAYGPHPSTQLFKSALRLAIQRYGVPGRWRADGTHEIGHLSVDNGKEFWALDVAGRRRRLRLDYLEDTKLSGFLKVLGIYSPDQSANRLHATIPKNARGKSWIESSFNRLSSFERALPGATGARAHKRPEKLAAVEERGHQEYLDGKRPESPLLLRAERRRSTDDFIDVYNFVRRHPARGFIPGQALARVRLGLKPKPAALDLLLWWRRPATVHGDKVSVHFGGVSRIYADERLLYLSGEQVELHCDPLNTDDAVIFRRGEFYCRVRPYDRLPQGASKEQLQAHGKYQRRLRRELKEMWGEVRDSTPVLHEAQVFQLLAEKARANRQALLAGQAEPAALPLAEYERAADAVAGEDRQLAAAPAETEELAVVETPEQAEEPPFFADDFTLPEEENR